ncbi:MAG: hypothetical protein AB7S97_06560 [Thermoplasmata archaeon]
MSLTEIMLLLGGLVLLMGVFYLIPVLGKYIEKLAKWLGGFQTLIGVISIIVAIWAFIDTGVDLDPVFLLIVGLILAVSIMSALPALGKYIAKLVKALGAFQVIIGIIAIVLAFV